MFTRSRNLRSFKQISAHIACRELPTPPGFYALQLSHSSTSSDLLRT